MNTSVLVVVGNGMDTTLPTITSTNPTTLSQPVLDALAKRRVFQVCGLWLVRGQAEKEWLTARGIAPSSILTGPRIVSLTGPVALGEAARRLLRTPSPEV